MALEAVLGYAGGMEHRKLPLERAFELAQSGKFRNTSDIKRQLAKEHMASDQVSGGNLLRQLRAIMKAAAPADKSS